MPAKPKRNALIIKLWNKGKSNQEILTALKRAGHKDLKDIKSLSGVIARLKRRGELPRERPQVEQGLHGGLTQVEREGIRELEQASGGLIKFQVGRQADKAQSKQRDKSTSQHVYKRVTYYLTPGMIKKIKLLAVKQDKDISGLVREILGQYLSKQGDL